MLSQGQKRPEELRRGDRLGAFAYLLVQRLFCLLGPRLTFAFFGWVGRRQYPKSSPAKVVRANVEKVYVDAPEAEREAIIEGVYKTVPLAMAEFMLQPYWKRHGPRLTTHNLDQEWLQPYLRNEKNAVFLLGHLAGWEAGAQMLSRQLQNCLAVYAPPKNALLETHFRDGRIVADSTWQMMPRDLQGLQRKLASSIRDGSSLLYLLDAPLPGPMLPFLGHTSPTALKPYELAAKNGVPLIPVRTGRSDNGLNFTIEVEEPIFATGTSEEDIIAFATQMNGVYTRWIKERPTQWYWADKFFKPNAIWEKRMARKAKPSQT